MPGVYLRHWLPVSVHFVFVFKLSFILWLGISEGTRVSENKWEGISTLRSTTSSIVHEMESLDVLNSVRL